MTVDMYTNSMVRGSGWATSTEIETASILLAIKINIWFDQCSTDKQPSKQTKKTKKKKPKKKQKTKKG